MIELERLIALSAGELSGDELDRVELHVLSCASCARTLERLLQLGSATRQLLQAGKLRSMVVPELSRRLDALGLITRRYRLSPDQTVACGVSNDDVYVLTELEADLTGVTRLDFSFRLEGGGELVIPDVPFDAGAGLAAFIERGDALRRLPTTRIYIELRAVEGDQQRVVAKYVLNHDAGRQ